MQFQYLQMRHRLKTVLCFHIHDVGTCRAARAWSRRFSHLSYLLWDMGYAEKSVLSLKIGLIIQFDMTLGFESHPS